MRISEIRGHITEAPWMRQVFPAGYESYLRLVGGRETLVRILSLIDVRDLDHYPVTVSLDNVVIDGYVRIMAARARGLEEVPAHVINVNCWAPSTSEAKVCVRAFVEAHMRKDSYSAQRLVDYMFRVFAERASRGDRIARAAADALRPMATKGVYITAIEAAPSVEEAALDAMRKVACCDVQVQLFEEALRKYVSRAKTPAEIVDAVQRALAAACTSKNQRSHVMSVVAESLREMRIHVRPGGVTATPREDVLDGCAHVLSSLAEVPYESARRMIEEARRILASTGHGDVTIVAAILVAIGRARSPVEAADMLRTTVPPVRSAAKTLVARGFKNLVAKLLV